MKTHPLERNALFDQIQSDVLNGFFFWQRKQNSLLVSESLAQGELDFLREAFKGFHASE